jgi:hypothetical protein
MTAKLLAIEREMKGRDMPTRGRPRKFGKKEASVLRRSLIVISEFHNARAAGEKYASALEVAQTAAKNRSAAMSLPVVKKIVTDKALKWFTLREELSAGGTFACVGYEVPPPSYPRVNARKRKQ